MEGFRLGTLVSRRPSLVANPLFVTKVINLETCVKRVVEKQVFCYKLLSSLWLLCRKKQLNALAVL